MPGLLASATSSTTTTESTTRSVVQYENVDLTENSTTAVLNFGSTNCSAGFTHEDSPSVCIPSAIGWNVNEFDNLIRRYDYVDEYVGNEAYTSPGSSIINRPIRRGIIRNNEAVCSILDYVLEEKLEIDAFGAPLLLTGSVINTRHGRETLMEHLFESIDIGSLCMMLEPILSLYAAGRTTGLAVKCGGEVTSAVPIFEGDVIRHVAQRSEIGGNDVINYLRRLMQFERGYGWTRPGEYKMMSDMVQACAYVERFRNNQENENAEEMVFRLPDGTGVRLQNERYLCGEVLFNPVAHGHYCDSIQDVTCAAIRETNVHVRRELLNNIVLTGKTTLMRGFSTRFVEEVSNILPDNGYRRVQALEDGTRIAWLGGAIYSSVTRSRDWITKEEYEEEGFESPSRRTSQFTYV